MNVSALLVACYPPPVRERWGEQLQTEVEHTVPLRWVNVVGGALGLWLNPAVWPASTSRQRRAVLTVTGAVILGAAALLLRAVADNTSDAPAAALMTAALAGLGLGGLLLCPAPPLHREGLTRVTRQAIRALWLPVVLAAAITAFAHQPGTQALLSHPLIHAGCVFAYWATLLLGVVQTCRLCTSLLTNTTGPPARWRVRAGLRVSAASLISAATVCLNPTGSGRATLPTVVAAALLIGLAAIAVRNSTTEVEQM